MTLEKLIGLTQKDIKFNRRCERGLLDTTYRSNDKLCRTLSPLAQEGGGEEEKEKVGQGITQEEYPL